MKSLIKEFHKGCPPWLLGLVYCFLYSFFWNIIICLGLLALGTKLIKEEYLAKLREELEFVELIRQGRITKLREELIAAQNDDFEEGLDNCNCDLEANCTQKTSKSAETVEIVHCGLTPI